MSLLSSFLASELVPALESALAAHEPDIQASIVGELAAFSQAVGAWVEGKMNAANPVATEAPVQEAPAA